jgi:ferredoxin-thioredoxin reductase catalytic subunit
MKQIDMSSQEFLDEIAKTKRFTAKINKTFGFVPHPNEEVNEGVIMGLARHKLLYGKRYCPCFMVVEDENGKHVSADDRTCPCKPALEDEIPNKGVCHCGIFCTPEYAKKNAI